MDDAGVEVCETRRDERRVLCHCMPQKLSDKGGAECGAHYGSGKSVYSQSLRKDEEMQAALYNGCQENNGDNHRCKAPYEEREGQHLLFNTVIYHEIKPAEIYGGEREADGGHGLVTPLTQSECVIREYTSDYDTCKYIPVQIYEICLVKAEDGGGITVLKHMLGGHQCEENQVYQCSPYDIAVCQSLKRDVWMMEKCRPPEIDGKADYPQGGRADDFLSFPPVIEIAVHAYESEAQHDDAPQRGAYPVDTQQRYLHGTFDGLYKYQYHYHHQHEQAAHYPVHIFPLRDESCVDGCDAAELNHSVDDKIDIAEEYRHITHRSEPELDCRIAHKCRPHTKPTRGKAGGDQQGDTCRMGADEICRDKSRCAHEQSNTVGKPELQPEHHGKIYRHPDQRRISGHQYVFLHQSRRADHIGGGGKIYAA